MHFTPLIILLAPDAFLSHERERPVKLYLPPGTWMDVLRDGYAIFSLRSKHLTYLGRK